MKHATKDFFPTWPKLEKINMLCLIVRLSNLLTNGTESVMYIYIGGEKGSYFCHNFPGNVFSTLAGTMTEIK